MGFGVGVFGFWATDEFWCTNYHGLEKVSEQGETIVPLKTLKCQFLARFDTAFLTFDQLSMKNGKFAGSVRVV